MKALPSMRPGRLQFFRLWFLLVAFLCVCPAVRAAGGKATVKLGSPIPDSSAPGGGYQLASLKVTIAPADAVAAGATWHLVGETGQLVSSASLLFVIADAKKVVVQFPTVPGFEVPIQPSATLTKGFETDLTFTYARTLPPILPASATAAGTRGVAFVYTPSPTGSAATSFAVTVGGGETLATLGLALNGTNGRLTGTPAKSGSFSLAFTASNAAGKSQPMTLALQVIDPGQLALQSDPKRGSVSVSPSSATNLFSQTATVTLTAKPILPDFLFSGWQFTGVTPTSLTSPKTTFSFTSTQLLVTATANFIQNPFKDRADTYTGRIAPGSGVALANTGTLKVTLTNLGLFTGKLGYGTGSYSFKGQLLNDGSVAPITIKRPGKVPALSDLVIDQLQLDLSGADVITGRLTADVPISFTLDRSMFDAKSQPCPQAARYSVVFQRDSAKAPSQYPQGHGFGAATVGLAGTVRFSGSLGDGTGLTQGAVLSKTGKWPFHALIYKNGGVLTGDLTFRNLANASDLDGTLDWIKPKLAGAAVTYPAGFTTRTSVIGARYDKTMLAPDGTVRFGEGNLGTALNPVPVTNTAGHFAATPPVTGFSFQVTASTGLFTGTLPAAAAAKPVKVQGVIFQKTHRGYGWFIGAPLITGPGLSTGNVEFSTP